MTLLMKGCLKYINWAKKLSLIISTYYYTGKSSRKYFGRFKGLLIIYIDIKNDWVSLPKEEKAQKEFQLGINEILSYELQNQTI